MNHLTKLLKNDKSDNIITKRYTEAEEAYIRLFGNKDDLNKYLSTYDYSDEDFLKLAIKLENCIKCKKRYKYLYMTFIERIWKSTLGPFISYKILQRDE